MIKELEAVALAVPAWNWGLQGLGVITGYIGAEMNARMRICYWSDGLSPAVIRDLTKLSSARAGKPWCATLTDSSTTTTVGLGRNFAWNQWARVNEVVDAEFRVIRSKRGHFLAMADMLRGEDNALDVRSCGAVAGEDVFSGFAELEEAFA